MQPRFERRTASTAAALTAQLRFRAGYDFLRLRADCGEVATELADWWEDFHLGSDEEREALLLEARSSTAPRTRRASGQAAPDRGEAAAAKAAGDGQPADEAAGGSTAPRKRRRRRRKPAGAVAATGGEGGPAAE